jgi:hypothetical protein
MVKQIIEQTNQEYINLKEHYLNSSKSTFAAYRSNYNKLYAALDETDITSNSEKTIIDAIDALDISNAHTRSAVVNIAITVRSLPMYQLGVKSLIIQRTKNANDVLVWTKSKNDDIELPTYDELISFMNEQFETGNFRGYVINYLLINYTVRNQDLVFDIVKTRKAMADKSKNYLWINTKGKNIIYQRNVYKTASAYGSQEHYITDEKFIVAAKHIARLQAVNKKNSSQGLDGQFIKNISSLPLYIRRYTLNDLGEGRYCKVLVNHYRTDISMLKTISNNRGTNLNTLLVSYNINFKTNLD